MTTELAYKRVDFVSDQEVRWCPGCGDYTLLQAVQTFLASLEVERERHVFVSGIGCAARFPYYVETYGLHSIHGRAPAIATGVALANPDLTVWVVTGDGDALSIGGNHLIHAMRRNVNVNILLFNNQIYGLTKGQYSPTSEVGKRTKTSPMGSIDNPFNPVSLALGAGASFVARTVDIDRPHTTEMLEAAYQHNGVSFVEIYQNCNVFNDKAFAALTGRSEKELNRIDMEHGKPVIFGPDNEYGVILTADGAKVVEVAAAGIESIYVHDAHRSDPSAAFTLSQLADGPTEPTPMGIFRSYESLTYNEALEAQVAEATEKHGPGDLADLLKSVGTWSLD